MDIETATQLTIVVLQALFNTLVSSSVVFSLNMAAGCHWTQCRLHFCFVV